MKSKAFYSKGNYRWDEKITLRRGENNCEWSNDKGLISNIYKQPIQLNYQKNKQPNQKMGKRPEQTFLQRRHTDGQYTHEKMLNISHY